MSTAIAAERIPLSFLLAQNRDEDPPVEPVVPFTAWRQEASGEWWPVNVTALMERTAAFRELDDRYATGVLRLDRVFVEPATIEWRAVLTPRPQGRHWKGAVSRDVTHGRARSDARQRSDERAIADQERRRHEEQLEREQLAAQRVPQSAQPNDAGAFTAEQAEGEPMQDLNKSPRTCKRCGKEKPGREFDRAGLYGAYCHECKPLEKAERAAGRAVPVKKAPIKSARKSRLAIPAELPVASASAPETTTMVTTIEEGVRLAPIVLKPSYSPLLANSPGGDHYRLFAIEPIQYIEANQLAFHEANVVKYITRWKHKDGLEDLRKARFYIDRLIELQEAHA